MIWIIPVTVLAFLGGLALAFLAGRRSGTPAASGEDVECYRTIFENSPSVMLLVDASSGRIVKANAAACRFYGYSPAELTGAPITKLNTLPEPQMFEELRRAATEPRSLLHFRHRLASGEVREVEVFTGPIRFEGRVVLHSIIHDIQDRRSAEQALLASERQYRALAEHLGEGLAMTGPDGRYRYCNKRFAEMLGCGVDDLLGGDATGFVQERDRAELRERLANPRPDRNEPFEVQVVQNVGPPLDCLLSTAPILDDQGLSTGSLILCTDITERKRVEETARKLQKSEGLSLMAGGIAHDFNNLFQSLQANLELVRANPSDPDRVRSSLDRALRIVGMAAALSRKLLDFSGRSFRQAIPVDLQALLNSRAEELRAFVSPGHRLLVHLADDLPAVEGDPDQLLQVVYGLVANADEALEPDGGEIRLTLERARLDEPALQGRDWTEPPPGPDVVCLTVEDSGRGIPPEHLGRIFDPFFSTKAAGRGLGLSASIGILRNHRAGLQVCSSPAGTLFRICFLPLDPERAGTRSNPGRNGRTQGRTILLVDDDADLREVFAESLRDLLGYQVLVAHDGVEAVNIFREHADQVSLILMDAVMPRLPGWKAFEAIKEVRPDAKAILCSGYGDEVGVDAVARHGFHSFLKKPFSIQELAEAVERALA